MNHRIQPLIRPPNANNERGQNPATSHDAQKSVNSGYKSTGFEK